MRYAHLFGIRYCITDYQESVAAIMQKAKQTDAKEGFGVSALAVHGLIESYQDAKLKEMVNQIDWVVPDGQPVRWALNYFHRAGLKDRVYGPALTSAVLKAAAHEGIPVFFYGSTADTLNLLRAKLPSLFPGIKIAGMQQDRFREATDEEMQEDIQTIRNAGARIVFVGRGCPRQERWVATHKPYLNMPLLAVGAAFDFLAGNFPQAPSWMQRNGLEWLFRLIKEPRRLWKRYLFTNARFIAVFIFHAMKKIIKP